MTEPITGGLVAFLDARYDEREVTARAAAAHDPGHDRGRWEHLPAGLFACVGDAADPDWAIVTDTLDAILAHIALNDPASVLADVASKRRVLAAHHHYPVSLVVPGFGCGVCAWDGRGGQLDPDGWCETVLALAAPFDRHPDYDPARDPAWRPA